MLYFSAFHEMRSSEDSLVNLIKRELKKKKSGCDLLLMECISNCWTPLFKSHIIWHTKAVSEQSSSVFLQEIFPKAELAVWLTQSLAMIALKVTIVFFSQAAEKLRNLPEEHYKVREKRENEEEIKQTT